MTARHPTWLALFLALMAFLALARLGHAAPSQWQEVHAAGVDVRVTVDRDGAARSEFKLSYRVVAGTLRSVELDTDDSVVFDPQGTVTAEDGTSLPLFVVRDDKGKLHISVDDAKGLKRGSYTFVVHGQASAVGALRADGAFLELTFRAPAQREGIDGMRVVFDLPSAPTEPRAKSDGAADDAMLSTLRRKADRDEIELVRPHVTRGESAVFRVRVDRKALTAASDALAPAPPVEAMPLASDGTLRWTVVLGAAIALLLVLRAKLGILRARRAVELRGLAPIAPVFTPYLAALAFGGAVYAQVAERHVLGGALLASALVLAAVRVRPRATPILAPGVWTPLDTRELFTDVTASSSPFDATRGLGRRVLFGAIAVIAASAVFALRFRADAPYLLLLDGTIILPIFFTGTESQLDATVQRTRELLRHCHAALARSTPVTAVGHVARGTTKPDEVRLLAVPKLAMPGVVGIELGVAWDTGDGVPAPRYGVLVRVLDGSSAASKMAAELRDVARPVTGRRPEERVYALWPRLPLAGAAVGLVEELAGLLRDRRKILATEPGDWAGDDRREALSAAGGEASRLQALGENALA